ncbi:MAG: DJ-1/PfpI family protein [Deltaproteobacteria bacterium]|nr:DJ-1/PfpI family protein [Deltaproteobacteria bacterium]MBW2447332.1 DJ-1/PfpI family protein [Deltaproteobacteria bacterium]
MATNIGIVLFPDAEELDWAGPFEVFGMAAALLGDRELQNQPISDAEREAAELRVFTVAQTHEPVRCRKGLTVVPEYDFSDAPALDVVCVPGGQGTRTEVDNPVLIDWLRKVGADCLWVTSVCTGALLLHEAGFAKGKRVTTHWAFTQALRERGDVEVLEQRRYVRDGNLLTAAGVSAGTDMALWLVGQLRTPDFARMVQRAMEYDPAPPYTAEV